MLIRHSVLYVIAKFLSGGLAMATTAILTRILEPPQYGDFGLVLVTMAFVSSFGFDWLGVSFLRYYSSGSDETNTVVTVTYLFVALLATSTGLALLVWIFGNLDRKTTEIVALGIALGWLFSWFELASKFKVAQLNPMQYLNLNFIRAILMLIGTVGVALLTRDSIGAATGMGLGLLAALPFITLNIQGIGPQFFDRDLAKRILKFGIPLAISMALGGTMIIGTRMLVAALDSVTALGLYTAAFVLVQNSLTVMASGISMAGFQLAVRAVSVGNAANERKQLLESGALLLVVLTPACVGVGLTADGLSHLLVGPKFEPAVAELMPWMAATAFFMSFRSYFLDYSFQLGYRPDLQAWVSGISAVLSVGLSIYLIPRMGPKGAAIAGAVTMALSCGLAMLVGRWAYPIPLPIDTAARVLLCCTFMTALTLRVPGNGIGHLGMQVAIGVSGYGLAALALNLLELRQRAFSYAKHLLRQRTQ